MWDLLLHFHLNPEGKLIIFKSQMKSLCFKLILSTCLKELRFPNQLPLNNIDFNLGRAVFVEPEVEQTCSARKRAFSQYTRVTNSIQPSSNRSRCEDANDSCNRSPKKWVPGKSGPNLPFREAAGQLRGETARQLITFYHEVTGIPWK